MSGPVERYDVLLSDLVAKARNAALRNKPTMWAYYLDAAEGLMDWFGEVERTERARAAALALSEHAQTACPNLNAPEAARLWARGVYARRILASWGAGSGPRVSLDWLRKRAAALVDDEAA